MREFGIPQGAVDDEMIQDALVERNLLKPTEDGHYRITAHLIKLAEAHEYQSSTRGAQYRYLPSIVEAVAELDATPRTLPHRAVVRPEDKLDWNSISIARDWFDEYGPQYQEIENLLDQHDPRTRTRTRQTVIHFYQNERLRLAEKKGVATCDENLRAYGDSLLFAVHRRISEAVSHRAHSAAIEDIESAARSLVVYYSIKCDILERPKAQHHENP